MGTTTATPSRATTISLPLKYFVLAFAFTWFFWGLAVLGARGVISTLPGFVVLGTFGRQGYRIDAVSHVYAPGVRLAVFGCQACMARSLTAW